MLLLARLCQSACNSLGMLTMSLFKALIGTAELFESIVRFPFRRPGSLVLRRQTTRSRRPTNFGALLAIRCSQGEAMIAASIFILVSLDVGMSLLASR